MNLKTPLMVGTVTALISALAAVALSNLAWGAMRNLDTSRLREGSQIDEVTALAAACVGAGLATWYALSALIGVGCLVARSTGAIWAAGEHLLNRRGAPGIARLVSAGAGAVLAASFLTGPAHAAPTAPESPNPISAQSTAPDDLGWGATARQRAEPQSPARIEASAPHQERTDSTRNTQRTTQDQPDDSIEPQYRVQVGDSLWSIAEDHLPEGATHADIAAAWPQWYEANAEAIGSDPNLIHPGVHLSIPAEREA